MRTVCVKRLHGAKLTVIDQRPKMPGFSVNLKSKGIIDINIIGANPLFAMRQLMDYPAALRWRRELEGKMPEILTAA